MLDQLHKDRIMKYVVEPLRSGKYEQDTENGALCYQGKYCCLGIPCEELKDELGLEVHRYCDTVYFGIGAAFLPPEVSEYLFGENVSDPFLNDENVQIRATCANDTLKYTFEQISGMSEETYCQ